MKIQLTPREMAMGGFQGIFRRVQSLQGNFDPQNHPPPEKGWDRDVEGCLGELALSKLTGNYWGGMSGVGACDVRHMEVRTTPVPSGHLILRDGDKDDVPYVLMIGSNGSYRVAGWILGGEGKELGERRGTQDRPDPCWWISQSLLTPGVPRD